MKKHQRNLVTLKLPGQDRGEQGAKVRLGLHHTRSEVMEE